MLQRTFRIFLLQVSVVHSQGLLDPLPLNINVVTSETVNITRQNWIKGGLCYNSLAESADMEAAGNPEMERAQSCLQPTQIVRSFYYCSARSHYDSHLQVNAKHSEKA